MNNGLHGINFYLHTATRCPKPILAYFKIDFDNKYLTRVIEKTVKAYQQAVKIKINDWEDELLICLSAITLAIVYYFKETNYQDVKDITAIKKYLLPIDDIPLLDGKHGITLEWVKVR